MGLLDLKTDLKSLKFGNPPASDRPGSGNSGQPYITDPISSDIIPQNEDFLLRGGLNAPLDAANDVVRLTKFFGDLKSPRGILFVAKQNILSRIGAATQASGNTDWKNAPLNEGSYTPLSTIAQAGVGFTGAHLYKQGLNPLKGVRTYTDIIKGNEIIDENENFIADNSIVEIDNNRLVNLYRTKFNDEEINAAIADPINVLTYAGGPGSDLGIGNTNIKFATNNIGSPLRTGKENIQIQNSGFFNTPSIRVQQLSNFLPPLVLSNPTGFDVFRGKSNEISDFREEIFEISKSKTSTVTGIAPNYSNPQKTIDGINGSRINYTSPGQRGNVINYQKGKIVNGNISVVDHINFLPIYKSENNRNSTEEGINDLVKFRIGAVLRSKGNSPPEKIYMHFRAFLDKFSDSYDAKWSGTQYMGRGEEFYKYGGFGRKISLSYTVAAQSKPELMAQYKKLNFLASTLAPDYGSSGYMGGVLTTLTLGGWCHELPGFISSLSLDIPQESPWEIAIGSDVEKGKGDKTVKEMPHICKVNMSFTPIHTFRPELQKNTWDGEEINTYGDQQYIGLTNGINNNYVPVSLSNAETPGSTQSQKA